MIECKSLSNADNYACFLEVCVSFSLVAILHCYRLLYVYFSLVQCYSSLVYILFFSLTLTSVHVDSQNKTDDLWKSPAYIGLYTRPIVVPARLVPALSCTGTRPATFFPKTGFPCPLRVQNILEGTPSKFPKNRVSMPAARSCSAAVIRSRPPCPPRSHPLAAAR